MESIKNILPKKDTNLEKYLKDALKDEGFKDFVSKFNVGQKDLLMNTTELEESYNEFNNCLDCKSIHECKNRKQGYVLLPENTDNLSFCYKKCKYQKKIDLLEESPKNISLFNVPSSLAHSNIKDLYMDGTRLEVVEWINDFIKNYQKGKTKKGLYLYGNFGCGKSYIISAMLNELAKKNVKSAIVFWPEFLRDLKESFDSNYDEKMEYIKNVELLFIDDIGAENVTPWARDEILCTILQYRMDNSLPVFFTSNLNLKELEEHFTNTKDKSDSIKAMRIMERIKHLSDNLQMLGKNLRK